MLAPVGRPRSGHPVSRHSSDIGGELAIALENIGKIPSCTVDMEFAHVTFYDPVKVWRSLLGHESL